MIGLIQLSDTLSHTIQSQTSMKECASLIKLLASFIQIHRLMVMLLHPALCQGKYEPCHGKTGFLHMRKTKAQISFVVTAKLISAFVFATWTVQSLYFLNPKFQGFSHLLRLYSPVYVGPGRKPRRPVFSQHGLYCLLQFCNVCYSIFTI